MAAGGSAFSAIVGRHAELEQVRRLLPARELRGTGQVTGNVTNTSGTVRPGTSPGTLTVTGSYTQGATGTLEVDVDGTVQGTGYDHLSVGGAATLDSADRPIGDRDAVYRQAGNERALVLKPRT